MIFEQSPLGAQRLRHQAHGRPGYLTTRSQIRKGFKAATEPKTTSESKDYGNQLKMIKFASSRRKMVRRTIKESFDSLRRCIESE